MGTSSKVSSSLMSSRESKSLTLRIVEEFVLKDRIVKYAIWRDDVTKSSL